MSSVRSRSLALMKSIVCPNCKGKGHVLSGVIAVCGGPLTWVLSLVETNDPNGLTREECDTCDGDGYIVLPSK